MRVRMFQLIVLFSAMALASLSVPTMSFGQSGLMTANVPFDFYVGARQFPAGVYTIQLEGASNSVVRINDGKGHHAYVLTIPSNNRGNRERASVLFNGYEGTHFLAEVRWMGAADARVLPKSPLEIQLAKGITPKQVAATAKNR